MGQVLANFYLKHYPKDPKMRGVKDPPEHLAFMKKLKKIDKVKYPNCTIQFSLLGIRNLIRKAEKPVITFKLTHDCQDNSRDEVDKKGEKSRVPNEKVK